MDEFGYHAMFVDSAKQGGISPLQDGKNRRPSGRNDHCRFWISPLIISALEAGLPASYREQILFREVQSRSPNPAVSVRSLWKLVILLQHLGEQKRTVLC